MLSVMIVAMGLLQLLAPLGLAFWLLRRHHVQWRLLGIGALVYLAYQAVQSPILQEFERTDIFVSLEQGLPQFTVFLILGGISAVIEQGLIAGGFWFVRKSIAEWKNGAAVALGHAGASSLVIGLLQLLNFAFVVSATTSGVQSLSGLSAQDAQNMQQYLDYYWAQAWYLPLAGMLQVMALLMSQLSQGMMVWLSLSRRAWIWAGAAVLWQTATNGALLLSTSRLDDLANDLVYVLIAAMNAGIFYFFYLKTQASDLTEIVNQ